MVLLKRATYSLLLLALGCGELPATDILPVETDTWISSEDSGDHSNDETLQLSLEGSQEERILLKIPTGKQGVEEDALMDNVLSAPLVGALLLPLTFFYVLHEILESLFDCDTSEFEASDLASATLSFGIVDDGEQALAGLVQLEVLSAPWWQAATWSSAHPFSERGRWSDKGGDIDSSVAPILATINGEQLEFDVTEYFREFIGADKPVHFGAVLRANSDLQRIKLASVQNNSAQAETPTLTANYNGQCANGTGTRVTRLGQTLRAPGKD
jgi:hypothetical protein